MQTCCWVSQSIKDYMLRGRLAIVKVPTGTGELVGVLIGHCRLRRNLYHLSMEAYLSKLLSSQEKHHITSLAYAIGGGVK